MGFGTAMLPYGARRGGGRGLACGWTASGCSGHREGSGPGRVTPRRRGGERAESDRERVSERVDDDPSTAEALSSTRHGTVTAARRWPPDILPYTVIMSPFRRRDPQGPIPW